jgi:hypothetical protein
MAEATPRKRIVYLFGAGATHAELQNIDPNLIEAQQGLLMTNVSSRVILKASRDKAYLEDLEMVSAVRGSLNIEMLISLVENSKIFHWESKTRKLKQWVREDIESILTLPRKRRFYLHKALFEFHRHPIVRKSEQLVGLISLNYDDVVDRAYREMTGAVPNYCFSLDASSPSRSLPLFKLHGSFNWSGQRIRGRTRNIEIIPLGSNKNYLHAPYGLIWSRALETLIECDTLRVIGCALSQNDFHLIDLLFKAHLEKGAPIAMEIIAPDYVGDGIQKNYGFFPVVKRLTEIEIKGSVIGPELDNPFRKWLARNRDAFLTAKSLRKTRYLRRLIA